MVFLGIGGIGMSALARHYLRLGSAVFGYDNSRTRITSALEQEGAQICYNEDLSHYPGWDSEETTVIYTPAVPEKLAWFNFFKAYNPIKRAQALALIANDHKCIAIAGTHGKTSTSAMLVHLMDQAGLDPTAFIGGIMTQTSTNYRLGSSDFIIVEADEFDRSLLYLKPWASAITTVDADHLDIYSDGKDLLDTFDAFVKQTNGPTFTGSPMDRTIQIGSPENHCWASAIEPKKGAYSFVLHIAGQALQTRLQMPGRHNVYNALLAASLAHHAGMSPEKIASSLPLFKGIERRFEFHLQGSKVLIEDYAHHPTEIKALMDSIDELYPNEKVCLIFQPHLYSRTRDFMDGFIQQLSRAEYCLLLPIYAAREEPIKGVNSQALAAAIIRAQVVHEFDLVARVKQTQASVILVVGAGDVGNFVSPLKEALS